MNAAAPRTTSITGPMCLSLSIRLLSTGSFNKERDGQNQLVPVRAVDNH